MVGIYVLPSEPGLPPRAMLGEPVETEEGVAMIGKLATWSSDTGVWLLEGGEILPLELSEAITAHAKDLGVDW